MELRDYQKDLINNIRAEIMAHKKKICAVLGCGGGKSVIQGMIAAEATKKKNRVLFIVHRKELCQQIERTFCKAKKYKFYWTIHTALEMHIPIPSKYSRLADRLRAG